MTQEAQINLLEERIVQQTERINGLNSQVASLEDQKTLIEDELDGVRNLHEQGFAPKTRLRALQREARRLGGESGALRAGVAEAHSIIAEASLEIERTNNLIRQDAIAELQDAYTSITELEERRVAALNSLERTIIRAPRSGWVFALSVHTIGGVISPGASLMEIVPDEDKLLIAARVMVEDIDKVRSGQNTLIRFSALGAQSAPETYGLVRQISADSISDDPAGVSYYQVIIDMPEDAELSEVLNGQVLIPGMHVETFIRTGSQPAISYLLRPLTDAVTRSMREG